MIRKSLTILSFVGLLLSVGLWGVSYLNISLARAAPRNAKHQRSAVNVFEVVQGALKYSHPLVQDGRLTLVADLWSRVHGFKGFKTNWVPRIQTYRESWNDNSLALSYVIVPLWIPTAIFGLLFLSCRPLHFHRRRKRKKLGLCVKCGYDLRGSLDRCPECGGAFEKQ